MSVQGGVKGHVGGSIRRDRERQHVGFTYVYLRSCEGSCIVYHSQGGAALMKLTGGVAPPCRVLREKWITLIRHLGH